MFTIGLGKWLVNACRAIWVKLGQAVGIKSKNQTGIKKMKKDRRLREIVNPSSISMREDTPLCVKCDEN